MNTCLQTGSRSGRGTFRHATWKFLRSLCIASLLLAAISTRNCPAVTVTYDTAPYWATISGIIGGMGQSQTATFGQTFLAPSGPNVMLNDFTFYAESYIGGPLYMQAFVYAWSPPGAGGGAVGSPLYLSPSFAFNAAPRGSGWTPLTANTGGVALNAGQQYVMGFTISNPANYAASQGYLDFQFVIVKGENYQPAPVPPGVDYGRGSLAFLNNGNNFGALNTTPWVLFSGPGQTNVMSFTAHFAVVPEPSTAVLAALGSLLGASRFLLKLKRSG